MTTQTDRRVTARTAESIYPVAIERHTGLALPHDPAFVDPFVVELILKGHYEFVEANLARHVVDDGDDVLELGAGLGFISSVVCRAKRVSSYLAVEANPKLIPLIRETHRLNGIQGVDVLNAIATSDPLQLAAGMMRFHASRTILNDHLATADEADVIEVKTAPLSPILRDRMISVMIVDVEGAEGSLFREADLSEVRAVMVEIHPQKLGITGVAKLFELMHRQGLIYNAPHSRGRVVTFSRWAD